MTRSLQGAMMAVVSLACTLPLGAAEKKDAKKKEAADPKAKAEKIVSGGEFLAILTNVSPNQQQDFTVQINFKYIQPNLQAQASYLQQQRQLLLQQQQALMIRNPLQRQQALLQVMRQAQQTPQNLYEVKEYKKDIELRAADEMKVRSLQPPIDYDEKGNIKKYTKKELKELKGDGSLPGYQADFDRLQPNQVVKVYLAKKKAAPPKKKGKKKKNKDPDNADEEDDAADSKPEVVMVVIVREAPTDKQN
jgi:hypothetical protein